MSSEESAITVTETGPQKFSLTVRFGSEQFECGTYISRTAAMQAGKLFVDRKQGEAVGRRKRPRGK